MASLMGFEFYFDFAIRFGFCHVVEFCGFVLPRYEDFMQKEGARSVLLNTVLPRLVRSPRLVRLPV